MESITPVLETNSPQSAENTHQNTATNTNKLTIGARRHGQEGTLVKCFVHCNTLSKRIIYALFSQPVVGFWRLCPQISTGAPFMAPSGKISPNTPNLLTPGKNSCGCPWNWLEFKKSRKHTHIEPKAKPTGLFVRQQKWPSDSSVADFK